MTRRLPLLILCSALTLPVPALAGGALSLSLTPRTGQEATLLRLGLAAYAVRRDVRTNGHVTQNGTRNAAAIVQGGQGSQAIIHQEGHGHHGSIRQNGNDHAQGLFQFGRNTQAHIVQEGRGQTGVTLVYGW